MIFNLNKKNDFLIFKKIKNYSFRMRSLNKNRVSILKKQWIYFGLDYVNKKTNLINIFKNNLPVIINIGFGDGLSFSKIALENLHLNFLGIEIYPPSILSSITNSFFYDIKNIKIIFYDAYDVLKNMIIDEKIFAIQIFFPDPWPKTRHFKRRLINKNFIKIIAKKIVLNGFIHIMTDWEPYAKEIYTLLISSSVFKYQNLNYELFPLPKISDKTKFEKKGLLLNNKIYNFIFKKIVSYK